MGHIKWSALSVSEAMDKAEAEIENIFEPLWQAHNIVTEAANIPNLPAYMLQRISTLDAEIHNIVGVDLQRHGSRVLDKIHGVRDTLPEGSVEMERKAIQWGKTGSLLG